MIPVDMITVLSKIFSIPYSGKFSREKIFMNFAILQPPEKVFSMKF